MSLLHPDRKPMRQHLLTSRSLLAAAVCWPALQAGEPIAQPNRLTFGPRLGFNVRAGFTSAVGNPASNPGPATGGGLDRFYDDGYVRVDSSGNADGKTWFWGYDNASQADTAADAITMSAVTTDGQATINDIEGDPYIGGELTYARYFFEWGRANWGLELGGSFLPVEIEDDTSLTALVASVRDAFSLGGVVPPPAPYAGGFQGPGVVIGDAPVRTATQRQATFSGNRRIETTAFALRFGPTVDIPLGKPLWMQLGGGLHLMYADTDFSYSEIVGVEGLTQTVAQSGSASEQEWIFGAYLRGQVLCALSRSVGIFGNVEYLMTDEIAVSAGSHRATMTFGSSLGCALGLAWSF